MRAGDFYVDLEKTPGDFDLRLVFADFLDGKGEALHLLSLAQRWMAEHRLHPVPINHHPVYRSRKWDGWWCWGHNDNDRGCEDESCKPAMLPLALWELFLMTGGPNPHFWRQYPSLAGAEMALAQVLPMWQGGKDERPGLAGAGEEEGPGYHGAAPPGPPAGAGGR
jgi:uncharacterized protein (TIGR02996 family)